MPNSKTWYSSVDYALPDVSTATLGAKSVLWTLKALMCGDVAGGTLGPAGAMPSGARWTVHSSSDSINADGTDRWQTSFNAAKLVRSAAGAHSWVVLQSPANLTGSGSAWYFTIDWLSSADNTAVFVLAKVAPTGGTASARPTSTDEVATAALSFTDTASWSATGGKAHYTADGNGNFWYFCSKNSSGIIGTAIGVNVLQNLRHASDLWPVAMTVDCGASNVGALKEGASSFYRNTSATSRSKSWTGTPAAVVVSAISYEVVSGSSMGQDMANSHPADNAWDELPVMAYSVTASYKGLKGEWPDCKTVAVSATIPPGSRRPATGDIEKVVCGNTAVPLTAVPSL